MTKIVIIQIVIENKDSLNAMCFAVFCLLTMMSKSIEKILKFSMIIYIDENSSSPLNLQTL